MCLKLFLKLVKEIIVVVKMGDFDFDKNFWLCLVVKEVKLSLVLKDVIDCVIKKL